MIATLSHFIVFTNNSGLSPHGSILSGFNGFDFECRHEMGSIVRKNWFLFTVLK